MNDKKKVLTWDESYNGPAIYSMTDINGMKYIGKTVHYNTRMIAHRAGMVKALEDRPNCTENDKIISAVLSGITFKGEILEKLPLTETIGKRLHLAEEAWLDYYGGLGMTYNVGSVGRASVSKVTQFEKDEDEYHCDPSCVKLSTYWNWNDSQDAIVWELLARKKSGSREAFMKKAISEAALSEKKEFAYGLCDYTRLGDCSDIPGFIRHEEDSTKRYSAMLYFSRPLFFIEAKRNGLDDLYFE